MAAPAPTLMYRQAMHGRSNGIIVLTLAGFFWFGLAGMAADCARAGLVPWRARDIPVHYLVWEPLLALAVSAVLIRGAIRVRRMSLGFRYSEIRTASEQHRLASRRIMRSFLRAMAAEAVLCGLAAYLCVGFGREDLLWPALGLVVSLHFFPLAAAFRVPAYRIMAAAGAAVCALALLAPDSLLHGGARWIFTGVGMGIDMWVTAAYVILRADRLSTAWE